MTNHRFEVKKAGADIVILLLLFTFAYNYFLIQEFPANRTPMIPSTRDDVNINSIVPLWMDGSQINVGVDFRVITLVLALVLFTSIFASIMLRQYIGGGHE